MALKDTFKKGPKDFEGCNEGEIKKGLGVKWLAEADLGGANLQGADMQEVDIGGANLEGANLEGANLRGANLFAANLREANLGAANLRDAYLTGTDLYEANLEGANLEGANLELTKNVTLAQLSEAIVNETTALPVLPKGITLAAIRKAKTQKPVWPHPPAGCS